MIDGVVVILLNKATMTNRIDFAFAEVGYPHFNADIRDLIAHQDIGVISKNSMPMFLHIQL